MSKLTAIIILALALTSRASHADESNNTANTITNLGAVKKPGIFSLRKGLRLVDVLATAGGFERLALRSKVCIKRTDGSQTKLMEIDVEKILAGDGAFQFMLAKSSDDGLSWSRPINITSQVKTNSNWCSKARGTESPSATARSCFPPSFAV